jgi:hypothetical protein
MSFTKNLGDPHAMVRSSAPGKFLPCIHSDGFVDGYGPPVMQRLTIRTGIYGSVEYGTDGCVTSVEISPEGYDRRVFAPNRSMDRAVVSGIIDFFVPPYQ